MSKIRPLYNSVVLCLMEYCVQVWYPYYQKDIAQLKLVKYRITDTKIEEHFIRRMKLKKSKSSSFNTA